jgi:hypothetical protein
MPISSFTYAPPVRRRREFPALDYEVLERAFSLAEAGQIHESIHKVLVHLFPTASIPDLHREAFAFVQGSSRVTVRIDGEELHIAVPLVRLPTGGGTVAALRYVLTRISGSGQLHQPRLRGDNVYLEFRDQVSRLHPAKLLEVLRRMPLEADRSDDWLIGQFAAQPLDRATIDSLDHEETERAQAIWRCHWSEIEELIKESQRKRSQFFLNELTAYALYRIRFALPLCGFLPARLNEAGSTFNDGDVDSLKREAALAKCVKDMKAVSSDELSKSLGHASYAISPLQEGKGEVLSSYFYSGDYLKTIDSLRTTGKPLDAALALVSTYTYLLGRYTWPTEMAQDLEAGLTKVSGLPWREAANTLYAYTEELLDRYDEEGDEGGDDEGGDDEDDDADDSDQDDGTDADPTSDKSEGQGGES